MNRLIDADELIKRLTERALAQHNIPLVEHDFRELIKTAETAGVVTCKDCKLYGTDSCHMLYTRSGRRRVLFSSDYCSYGERRTDEHKYVRI